MTVKNATIQLTPAQRLAVETTGRDVLVSASAGTGKTATLSHRFVQRVCDPTRPVDVDQILVLTFTDAAAEEMRARIGALLRSAAQSANNSRLWRQWMLLDGAYIGTIHSFCKRILTEFFYAAGVDPAFEILDPDIRPLLQADTLQQTLEAAWQQTQTADAMRQLFAGRWMEQTQKTDFTQAIIRMSNYLDSVAERQTFYDLAAQRNDCQSPLYRSLLDEQKIAIKALLKRLGAQSRFLAELDNQLAAGQYFSDYLINCVQPMLERLSAAVDAAPDQFAQILNDSLPSAPRKPRGLDDAAQTIIKSLWGKIKDGFSDLRDWPLACPAYAQCADIVGQQAKTMADLLKAYDARFEQAKLRLNALDFADLERKTLAMLSANPQTAKILQERFAFILVDETQDLNFLQKRILDCIRRPDNLFAVGDIKQSIYGFRQSRPELFAGLLKTATAAPDGSNPLRVDLKDNYRSRPEILAFVNHLFGRLMRADVCDVDYNAAAHLKSGLNWPPPQGNPSQPVELWLLEQPDKKDQQEEQIEDQQSDDVDAYDAAQTQALWIARRIRQLVGADGNPPEMIYDRRREEFRPISYGDIVILMRNFSAPALQMIEILRLANIPVHSQQAEGFFQTVEVTDCLNLLQALDNPYRDLELAAALRSPLFGLTDSDLTRLRYRFDGLASLDKSPLYSQLRRYADAGDDADCAEKCRRAVQRLDRWRQMARQNRLAELLDDAFYQAGLMTFYAAMPNGKLRCANLHRLYQRAVEFQQTQQQNVSLPRFVRFIEQLLQERQDWQSAQIETAENAVRLMSAHKSKGLEFPVVFAANLASRFNQKDLTEACLIDEQLIGLKTVLHDGQTQIPSLARQLLSQRKKRLLLAEEMRILYVMLTRAQHKLILTSPLKNSDALQAKLYQAARMRPAVADWLISQATSHLEWICAGLADYPPLLAALDIEQADNPDASLCHIGRVSAAELQTLQDHLERQKESLKKRPAAPPLSAAQQNQYRCQFDALIRRMQQDYPFQIQTVLPAKWTVSGLAHLADTFALPDNSFDPFSQTPESLSARETSHKGLSSQLIGEATHRVFETLPLDKPLDIAAVEANIAELVQSGLIPPQAGQAIDAKAIAAFFATPVGQAALSAGNRVLREWPFTLAAPASELAAAGLAQAAGCDEPILIQGIVDIVIPVQGGLIVADFKTDRIPSEQALRQKMRRYGIALDWYARAAQQILGQPVLSRWLYFAAIQQCVQV